MNGSKFDGNNGYESYEFSGRFYLFMCEWVNGLVVLECEL